MEVSKTKTSFYRRLYVAWLIDSGTATSVPALMEATGVLRRTPCWHWANWIFTANSSKKRVNATTPGITRSAIGAQLTATGSQRMWLKSKTCWAIHKPATLPT
jgi:hypothetical protein